MSNALKSFEQDVESEVDVHQQLCHHVGQAIDFEDNNVLFAHQTDCETVDAGLNLNFFILKEQLINPKDQLYMLTTRFQDIVQILL